ncbi:nucleotidyltransferase family protein [Planctomycetota bacterium]
MPTMAILAGGLGTRLRPATQEIPKSLIDVNGQPFIAHQLRLLRGQGVRRVVVCTGHLGGQIEQAIGSGQSFGLSIRYSHDGDRLLGTAGALRKALPLLEETFFVTYGDSYLPCDLRAVHRTFAKAQKPALMTVYENRGQYDRSNVEFSDGRICAYRKDRQSSAMHHIDYGLGVFHRRTFDEVRAGERFDLATLYAQLLQRGALAAHEVTQRFYEIGSPAGLEETRHYLLEQERAVEPA